MNFFERQQAVRTVSVRLVALFVLAVLGIIAVIDLAVWLAFRLGDRPTSTAVGTLVLVSAVAAAVIGLTSVIRTLLLRRGGGQKVARGLGAVPVPDDPDDEGLRRLRNVVEEIAIASGTPVPDLYVLPREPGVNAFAAGWSPANAAIVVTQGTLERLNRAELQGVLAHEFSHVVNGDMRLNIRLMGVLAGIVGLAVVGRVLLAGGHGGRGDRNSAAPLLLVALAALIAGYVGVVAGRLIKAAVSRQREYLADASAVQYTRQTEGIAGALKKIGGLPTGSTLRSGKVDDVSHMLFGEGRKLASLFATHPPLPDRIRRLDPTFEAAELDRLRQRWSEQPPSGLAEDTALGLTPDTAPTAASTAARTTAGTGDRTEGEEEKPPERVRVRPDDVAATVGNPDAVSYVRGETLLARIPEPLRRRAHQPGTAPALVYGLALAASPQARDAQHAAVEQRHGRALADAARHEAELADRLDPRLRLPLAEVALPALRHRPPREIDAVLATLAAVTGAGGDTGVSSYCLSVLLRRDLHEARYQSPPWQRRRASLRQATPAVATLLATLAGIGHRDQRTAERAYRAGLERVLPSVTFPFVPPTQDLPTLLDTAWPTLDGLSAADTRRLVEGVVAVIAHDGTMTVEESELLRTVCSLLRCPLPPQADAPARPPHSD